MNSFSFRLSSDKIIVEVDKFLLVMSKNEGRAYVIFFRSELRFDDVYMRYCVALEAMNFL